MERRDFISASGFLFYCPKESVLAPEFLKGKVDLRRLRLCADFVNAAFVSPPYRWTNWRNPAPMHPMLRGFDMGEMTRYLDYSFLGKG